MAGIITASIDVSKLPKEKFYKGKKGVYYEFTISVFDEPNQFNQNVAITDSQTPEEREAKKPKNYLGNGKVVWTNNILNKIENTESPKKEPEVITNDLPF
jgi:hypothetical protein|tara:strand:+ start:937 stop:1236 length:300 start_codon:yes stop_codon:yes gene_type:complete